MLAPLLNLLFLACVWATGSVALQQICESRKDIVAALLGQGGLKRLPKRAGA